MAAVTGATGFLGRHLVRELQAQGWHVRALVRRETAWEGEAPEVVPGALEDAASLRRLCEGADALLHLAGRVKARRSADFSACNVEGARRVARAARDAAPTAAFVLVSSLAAREPQLSPYAASKAAGEAAVREALGGRAAIVRPPVIYGPGDRETLPLFQAAARGWLPLFNTRGRLSVIHVADAARQIAFAADGRLAGRTVALSDARPDGHVWREILLAAGEAVGRPVRLIPVTDALVLAAGALGDLTARLGAEPFLTSGKAREALHRDWSLSPEERDLDAPPPRFDLGAGFADTVAWARRAGRLPAAPQPRG